MLDGLWTLEYEGDAYLSGGGVVVVQNTNLLGGDSWYYFQGTIDQRDDSVYATVLVKAFISSAVTIFGVDKKEFSVKLSGDVRNDIIRARISPDFAPTNTIGVTLIKRS
jgi:hypothetical protein